MLETICPTAQISLFGVPFKFGISVGGVLDASFILMTVMTK